MAGAGALDEEATVAGPTTVVIVVPVVDEDEADEDDEEADATGPVPGSSVATGGAALPTLAPLPEITAGAVPG